jgi:hypothetical protein
MRKLAGLAFFVFCFAAPSLAQTTTVTGQVLDPASIPYSGAQLKAQLTLNGTNVTGQPVVTNSNQAQCISAGMGNAPCKIPFQGTLGPISLDPSGNIPGGGIVLQDNTLVTPAGTQWTFSVSITPGTAPPVGTGPQSFQAAITISGASQNIGATLTAAAPKLTNFSGSGSGTVTSASCGNLVNVFNCSVATPASTPAFSFTPITTGPVLDCSQQAGADMGAKLNACIASLPASGGIADATKFSSPQTISTGVVNNKAAVIQTCGIAISQTANISLTATQAAWHGCQDQATVITKAANIDQITMSANYTAVDFVTLLGASASFTGNGIVENNASLTYAANNRISDEAGAEISLTGSTFYGQIVGNDLSGYVGHAILESGGGSPGFEFWIQHNKIDDTATATGSAVELVSPVLLTENDVTNTHGFLAVHNTSSSTNASVYSGNYLQSIGTGGIVISVAGQDYIDHNTMFNTGAHAVIVGGSSITDNNLQPTAAGADAIDNPSTLRPIIKGNNIAFQVAGVAGFCAINLNAPALGWEGGYIANNTIGFAGTGSGANYGVCLTTQTGQFGDDIVVENNDCISSTGGGPGSACVFFNNTAGITTNGSSNVIRTNQCIGINICIARTDTQNLQNYYENNASGLSTTLFGAGGSTNDVIVQTLGVNGTGTTFANLPTAGNGSQIYTTDATCSRPATSGGSGCMLFRINGVWAGVPLGGSFGSTTNVTASNPTINTDTNLIQLSPVAGYFNVLTNSYTITGAGNYTSTAASSPALTFKIRLCTVSGCGSGTVQTLINIVTTALSATALTNATWTLSAVCVTNATGATGNLVCKGTPGLTLDTGASIVTPDSTFADTNTATSGNIDLTAALFVQFSVAQSVAGASNSYVQTMATLK